MSAEEAPARERWLVRAVIAGGLVAVLHAAAGIRDWGSRDVLAFALIVAGVAVCEQFALPIQHAGGEESSSLTDAVLAAGLLLSSPSALVLAGSVGVAAGLVVHRVEARKLAFNSGQFAVALAVATACFHGLAGAHSGAPHAEWFPAFVAMAAYFAVNELAVASVIALSSGVSFLAVLLPTLALSAVTWIGNTALGILAALVWDLDRFAVPLLIAPLALSFLAYRSWHRTSLEREQMHAMATSAAAISAATDLTRRMPEAGSTAEMASLARTLNGMLGRLEASLAREHRFLRDASHELRTPLTICRGHLEVLSADPSPEEIESTHAVVIGELARMGRIVEDMSTLVRSEHAGFLRPERVAVRDLLERIGRSAGLFLDGTLVVDDCPPGAVSADPQRLTQALLNLLRNAEVHARGNGVHVGANLTDTGEACTSWVFYVRDQGGGLPPGSENAVFQPFHRMDHSRPGSGLGLAIVRGIAEAHGGTAGVENEPGVGATFWIRIPSTAGDRA